MGSCEGTPTQSSEDQGKARNIKAEVKAVAKRLSWFINMYWQIIVHCLVYFCVPRASPPYPVCGLFQQSAITILGN